MSEAIDSPNVIARPPLIYLVSLLAGSLLELFWPAPFAPGLAATLVGIALVIGALVLFSLAARRFQAAGTPLPTNQTPQRIVQDGPYGWSRNPIYLAMTLLHLGIALWVNSLWLLLALAITFGVMVVGVILREERYLAARFGEEYLSYKARVRRWL